MICPNCGSCQCKVIDSRPSSKSKMRYKRRQRMCLECDSKFTTYEVYAKDYKKVKASQRMMSKLSVIENVINSIRGELDEDQRQKPDTGQQGS